MQRSPRLCLLIGGRNSKGQSHPIIVILAPVVQLVLFFWIIFAFLLLKKNLLLQFVAFINVNLLYRAEAATTMGGDSTCISKKRGCCCCCCCKQSLRSSHCKLKSLPKSWFKKGCQISFITAQFHRPKWKKSPTVFFFPSPFILHISHFYLFFL